MLMEDPRVASRHNLALVEPRAHGLASLIAQVARGDVDALAALYDETAAQVHGLVLRIVGDPSLADEVTADVFVQVWQKAPSYDAARGPALPWLLLLARSRALDRRRSGAVVRTATEPIDPEVSLPSAEPGPLARLESAERRQLVVRALTELPAEQRRAVELAYYRGLSHAEIAAATGEPLGTVKTRIRTAMTRLRAALGSLRSLP
jgi:RNA polymerase sigma-70 factor (ECF subfamily)